MIEFVIEAGKYLFKFYEKNAEAQNLVLSIQRFIDVGAPEEARKCCYELIRLSHKHPDVYFLLATAQYELKEYDNCLKAIQKAIEVKSSHSYWELKGDALKALDRYQEAIDAYNQAIKLNPSSQSAKPKRDACQEMLPPRPSSQPFYLRESGTLGNLDFGSFSNSITPPSIFPSISSSSASNIELRSAKEIYYRELEQLLKAKKWYEADQLTDKLMLKASGREKEGWIDLESIKKFPCEDLQTIDRLWVHYSDGLYGFSAQKQIYVECGGNLDFSHPNSETWGKFCDRTAWRSEGTWGIYIDQFKNNVMNVKGHLPLKCITWRVVVWGIWWGWDLFSRIEACEV